MPKGFPSSHWPEKKSTQKGTQNSEYQGTISNVGGIIMSEKLNDHSKCKNICSHLIMTSKFENI